MKKSYYLFLSVMICFSVAAQLTEVDTFAELQQHVDPNWTEGSRDKLHPPGAEFNLQLRMTATGDLFPQSFLDTLSPIQGAGGVTLYNLRITESEDPPFTRTWQDLEGNSVATTLPPLNYSPQQWVLNTFPPPDYVTSDLLDTYVHDRRPGRKTLHLTLIRGSELPLWEQAMLNIAIENAIPEDPENLAVGSLRVDADLQGMELLTEIPLGVNKVGLYSTDELSTSIQWVQEDTVDIYANPQWIHGQLEGELKFFLVGNHSLDSDLDGLMDVYERLISHTNANNADSDGDGINDHDELYKYETDPNNKDSDGDGLEDGWEVENGGNPTSADSDGDGKPDNLEDLDGDGLTAKMEQARGTDPTLIDTDEDGVPDFTDAVGYDPFFTFKAAPEVTYSVIEFLEPVDEIHTLIGINNSGTVVYKTTSHKLKVFHQGNNIDLGEADFIDFNNHDVIYTEDTHVIKMLKSDGSIEVLGEDYGGYYTHIWEGEPKTFPESISMYDSTQEKYLQKRFDSGDMYIGTTIYEFKYRWNEIEEEDQEFIGTSVGLWKNDLLVSAYTELATNDALAGYGNDEIDGYSFTYYPSLSLTQMMNLVDSTPTGEIHSLMKSRNNGDTAFEVTKYTAAHTFTQNHYVFSDEQEYDYSSQPDVKLIGIANLAEDPETLWKMWWKGDTDDWVISTAGIDTGGRFKDGALDGPLWRFHKVAENGLSINGRVWRNGRILNDEDLLGPNAEWGDVHVNALSENGEFLAGTARKFTVLPDGTRELQPERYTILLTYAEILPDYNRDGVINDKDRNRVNKDNPWHWWINDDNDVRGEERGNNEMDIPDFVLPDRDYRNWEIDGVRDIIDFFPLHFDLKNLLLLFPEADYAYTLRNEDEALQFYSSPDTVLDGSDPEHSLRSPLLSVAASRIMGAGQVKGVWVGGVEFPADVLAKAGQNQGVLYMEGAVLSTTPLILEIKRKSNDQLMTQLTFHTKISKVEEMFRRLNLRSLTGGTGGGATLTGEPLGYPDSRTNGNYVAYIHGYNVSGESARGSQSNIFKRFHQLGSKARFVGISWFGNPDNPGLNLGLPPDYHKAVKNGLKTGRELTSHLGFIGEDAELTVLAHSLGNSVAGHAIANHNLDVKAYYIINGAIALETYDANQTSNSSGHPDMARNMTEDDWKKFYDYGEGENEGKQRRIFAANWHQLFEDQIPEDPRSKLTWKNLFASPSLLNVAYNFYSPSDEIVENANETEEFGDWDNIWSSATMKGRHAWVQQEIGKGGQHPLAPTAFYDNNGGWEFNFKRYGPVNPLWDDEGYRKFVTTVVDQGIEKGWYREYTVTEVADEISNEDLKNKPFHFPFYYPELYDPVQGPGVAADPNKREKLLATGVPAMSYAIAANSLDKLEPEERNFNMPVEMKSSDGANEWPKASNALNREDWMHSDFKNMSLQFVYPMYQRMIDIAELN